MFDLAAVRQGLAHNLQPVADLLGMTVTPYMLSAPSAPVLEVMGPDETVYDVAMQRGGDSTVIVVRAFVAAMLDQAAQIIIDQLIASSGPTSVKEALQSDCSLGGAVDDLRVRKNSGYMLYPRVTGALLGTEWEVQVESTG